MAFCNGTKSRLCQETTKIKIYQEAVCEIETNGFFIYLLNLSAENQEPSPKSLFPVPKQ